METSQVDPHLEEIVQYSVTARRRAFVEIAPALGGFVAALVLMPSRWLVLTALLGGSCLFGLLRSVLAWRKLRRRLVVAAPVPRDAVEVERQRSRVEEVGSVPVKFALLLGAGWVWSALADAPFAWGLLFAAVLLGADAIADVVERWSIGKWERRNGRILTSLLLGEGTVFYVDRSAYAA